MASCLWGNTDADNEEITETLKSFLEDIRKRSINIMYVSIYSVASAVFWVTVFTKLASCFRRKLPVLRYVSFYPFLLVLLLCIMRAALPLELPYTGIIKSVNVLPRLQRLSRTLFFQCGYIKITPAFLAYAVWMFGAAAILMYRIRDYRRLGRLLDLLPASQDSHLYWILALADTQGRLKNVKIIVHESVRSPAAAGFIHPVLIPAWKNHTGHLWNDLQSFTDFW